MPQRSDLKSRRRTLPVSTRRLTGQVTTPFVLSQAGVYRARNRVTNAAKTRSVVRIFGVTVISLYAELRRAGEDRRLRHLRPL
jgi:hypothetical protein